MGKKDVKDGAAAAEHEPTEQPRTVPACWTDELTMQEREAEVAKMAERQRKAEAAAEERRLKNERQRQWEKEQENKMRAAAIEDRKWKAECERFKARALQEGVLESEDYGDGKWWVNLGNGTYKEVQGQYYCPHCNKHLHDGTLEPHLNTDAHRRWVEWAASPSSPATGAVPNGPAHGASPSGLAPGGGCAALVPWHCSPCQLEPWQERLPDGCVKCLPCGRVIDDSHLASKEHQRRLNNWQEADKLHQAGYPTPELPYLAWMPEDSDPNGARHLRCLLCNKWAGDGVSHVGMPQAPGGSSQHQKNMRNWCQPGNPWYEENVVQVRRRWHPPAAQQRGEPQAAWAPQTVPEPQQALTNGGPASSRLPAQGAAVDDAALNAELSRLLLGDAPRPAALAAVAAAPAPTLELLDGWATALSPEGETYYIHWETGQTQWDPPVRSLPTEVEYEC